MKDLKGKVVFITGGNSGIGKAAALAFSREGVKVALCARRQKEGEEVVASIKKAGGEAIFIKADVSVEQDVIAAIEQTLKTYGSLDLAFNNAGISGKIEPLHLCTNENWQAIMDVNLKGTFYCLREEIKHMLAAGGGVIVNNASMGGLVGHPGGASIYSASKHAVIGLTKCAALEYARQNIRVNAVCPSIIDTPLIAGLPEQAHKVIADQHPIGRIGTPEEVAGLVVFLCSEAASFLTGLAVPVDGGFFAT